MSDEEEMYLVCEHAEAPMTVPGSSFRFHCSKCNRRVMVAPSGLSLLRERPEIAIICLTCSYALKHEGTKFEGLTAEQRAEIEQPSVPNPWKERN
jgi:hypothetical protein